MGLDGTPMTCGAAPRPVTSSLVAPVLESPAARVTVEQEGLLLLTHVAVIVHPFLAKYLRHHPLLVLGQGPGVNHENLIARTAHVALVVRLRYERGRGGQSVINQLRV